MTGSSDADPMREERRALFIANIVIAMLGGLSLVLAVTTPFSMGMFIGASFTDVMMTVLVCGGFPLLCAASIGYSRWLFERGTAGIAFLIAVAPLLLFCLLLVWTATSG